MSLVDVALARQGLDGLLAARLEGRRSPDAAMAARSELARRAASIDPILLGAMADRARATDRGDVVRVFIDRPRANDDVRLFATAVDASSGGLGFVREVALARLVGAPDLAIRVDAEAVGMQIAQVALAFGADELIAPVRTMRIDVVEEADDVGEPLVRLGGAGKLDDAARAILREREIAVLVRGARRTVRVVELRNGIEHERDVDETTAVKRMFRAPGRDKTTLAASEGAE